MEENWPEEIAAFLTERRRATSSVETLSRTAAYDLIALEIAEFVRGEKAQKEAMGNAYKKFSRRIYEIR